MSTDALAAGLARIREELDVPVGFPPEVEAAARAAVDAFGAAARDDRRDLPLVTLDPLGSQDLDQAFALEPRGSGWTVWYAIADVAAVVAPAGPIDVEARARGLTLYLPDGRAPLHPPVLSEGSASLLPGQDRPAVLWRLDIDDAGRLTSGRARRALVRSRAQLDYEGAQAALDAGHGHEAIVALRTVGAVLQAAEEARGGVSLPLPEQVVDDGKLAWRSPVALEGWNAQLSLLCGRAAANLVLQGGFGLLRTMPPADERTVKRIARAARALGVEWPEGPPERAYPAFVRSLDPATSTGAALLQQAARALRGAGYVAFGPGVGAPPVGDDARHSAVAAPYAHVTAPLRRLCDRFAAEAALAVATQVDLAEWVLASLPAVPDLMEQARQREGAVTRAVLDLAEAVVLAGRVGAVLEAVVVGVDDDRGADLQLLDPPVRARTAATLELGADVHVKVEAADPIARKVTLTPV